MQLNNIADCSCRFLWPSCQNKRPYCSSIILSYYVIRTPSLMRLDLRSVRFSERSSSSPSSLNTLISSEDARVSSPPDVFASLADGISLDPIGATSEGRPHDTSTTISFCSKLSSENSSLPLFHCPTPHNAAALALFTENAHTHQTQALHFSLCNHNHSQFTTG